MRKTEHSGGPPVSSAKLLRVSLGGAKGVGGKGVRAEDENWQPADLNSSWYAAVAYTDGDYETCRDSRKIIACISDKEESHGFLSLSLSPPLSSSRWSWSRKGCRGIIRLTGGIYSCALTKKRKKGKKNFFFAVTVISL